VDTLQIPNLPNYRARQPTPALEAIPSPLRPTWKGRVQRFFAEHGRKLWWLHSLYALAIGIGVLAFAQKGFEHARWLSVSLVLAWFLVVAFFRVFGSGNAQKSLEEVGPKTKVRFYVMTYALKNLYQGMLFFLLPFYWKATTFDAYNAWFVLLLGACAVLSTLDIVFDRVLMKWRSLASAFHGIILFGCLNLVIPAVFADARTLVSMCVAAGVAVLAFWTFHLPTAALRKPLVVGAVVVSIGAGVGLGYAARRAIPPVPMYVSSAAVGPKLMPDGRLAMQVTCLDASVITELQAVTDVVVPGGSGRRLHHVWRHEGVAIERGTKETRIPGPVGTVRLASGLVGEELPKRLAGHWMVDVETEDAQLVGRTEFDVTD
jgi:uncharacterized protein DUF5924/DUF2914 family protein